MQIKYFKVKKEYKFNGLFKSSNSFLFYILTKQRLKFYYLYFNQSLILFFLKSYILKTLAFIDFSFTLLAVCRIFFK